MKPKSKTRRFKGGSGRSNSRNRKSGAQSSKNQNTTLAALELPESPRQPFGSLSPSSPSSPISPRTKRLRLLREAEERFTPYNQVELRNENNLVAPSIAPYSGKDYGLGYGSHQPLSLPEILVERVELPANWVSTTAIEAGRRQNRGNTQTAENKERETVEKKGSQPWVKLGKMRLINAVGPNPTPPHLLRQTNEAMLHAEKSLVRNVRYRLHVSTGLTDNALVRRLGRAWELRKIDKFSTPANIEIIRLLLQQYPDENTLLQDIKRFLKNSNQTIGVALIQALLPKASADNEPYLLQNSLFRVMDKRTELGVCAAGNDEVWLPCVPSQASEFVTVTFHPLLGGRNGTIPSIQGVHILFAFIRFCDNDPRYDDALYTATKGSEDTLMRRLCQLHKSYVPAFARSRDFSRVLNDEYTPEIFIDLFKETKSALPPFYKYEEDDEKIKCIIPEYILFSAMAALQQCVGDMFSKKQSAMELIKKGTFTDTSAAHDFKKEETVGKVVSIANKYLEPLVFGKLNPLNLHFVFMTNRVLQKTAAGDEIHCIELSMYKVSANPVFTREFLFEVYTRDYKPFTVDWLKTVCTFDTALAVTNISLPRNTVHAVNVLSFDPAPKAKRNPGTDITVVDTNMLVTTDKFCLVAEYSEHSDVSVVIHERVGKLKKPSIVNTLAAGVSRSGATPKPSMGAFASAGIVPIEELLLPRGVHKLDAITTNKHLIALLTRIREEVPELNNMLDVLEFPIKVDPGGVADRQRSRIKATTYGDSSMGGKTNMTSNPGQNIRFREALNRLLNLLTPVKHLVDINICLNPLGGIDLKMLALPGDGKQSINNRVTTEYAATSGTIPVGYFERVTSAVIEFNNSFERLSSLHRSESDVYEGIKEICRRIVGTG